jgi:hypothetical protein
LSYLAIDRKKPKKRLFDTSLGIRPAITVPHE